MVTCQKILWYLLAGIWTCILTTKIVLLFIWQQCGGISLICMDSYFIISAFLMIIITLFYINQINDVNKLVHIPYILLFLIEKIMYIITCIKETPTKCELVQTILYTSSCALLIVLFFPIWIFGRCNEPFHQYQEI